MKLTSLALEIIKLIHDIERYNKAHANFLQADSENFKQNTSLGDIKIVNDENGVLLAQRTKILPDITKLRAFGWKIGEILSFSKWDEGIIFLERSPLKNVLLCLILKYLLIHFVYRPSERAEELMIKIIIDEIVCQLSIIEPKRKVKAISYRTPNMSYSETVVYLSFLGLFNSIIADIKKIYSNGYNLSSCKYIGNETRNLIHDLL